MAWADPRGLPSHTLLQAFSFKVWELDVWEWCALLASAITVGTFLWANILTLRHGSKGTAPSWPILKIFYALQRLKALCVAATILTSLFALTWFVHDTCTLPDALTQVLTLAFGPPAYCLAP